MCNMPYAFPMMPSGIPDPAFIKRKVFLAKDVGDDRWIYLKLIEDFCLRRSGYCDNRYLQPSPRGIQRVHLP